MKIGIELKDGDGYQINQPMTEREWKYGYMVGAVRCADNRREGD